MSEKKEKKNRSAQKRPVDRRFWCGGLLLAAAYFLVEVFAALMMKPGNGLGLGFGALWAVLLASVTLLLPRLAGRIFFGISYFVITAWTLAQTGYYMVFRKFMWLADMRYVSEGSDYFDTVLTEFPLTWWLGGIVLLALGVVCIVLLPRRRRHRWLLCTAAAAVLGLCLMPQAVYLQDTGVWGTRSDYMQAISYRAIYNTMYDARKVYDTCGMYQLTVRDLWKHELYPLTPAYRMEQAEQVEEIDAYFQDRETQGDNDMTGIFQGKNVILVLMESMDDWAISEEDTPTISRLMKEGINFANFYTPGFGSVRTFNSEFCVNTGTFLPTTGAYAFNYVTNDYNQSLASRLTEAGYNAQTFHYNEANFYSRGVFEPAMGYEAYNSYMDYTAEDEELFDDCYLFDNPELRELFFRGSASGEPTLNFIITRSAHLSYVYREVLSAWALRKYPQYKGISGDEEVDCMRVKAKLVDDMFARLLTELEAEGELENTVIVAFTDHYTYGFKDVELMMELSGVDDELLLEKTPCFIWSADGPQLEVDKTLNTSDLLPTVLNLLGIDSPYPYLGQDAFDGSYLGWALFSDGGWISDGVACRPDGSGLGKILANETGREITQEYVEEMTQRALKFTDISNKILETNYYGVKHEALTEG